MLSYKKNGLNVFFATAEDFCAKPSLPYWRSWLTKHKGAKQLVAARINGGQNERDSFEVN